LNSDDEEDDDLREISDYGYNAKEEKMQTNASYI